jgi:folate-binding protein YgfZ
MSTPLSHTDILSLSGRDAAAFAHAQFTTDVHSLDPCSWQWSAWLDPQGRTRAVFVLLRVEPDRFLAWLPLGGAQVMHEQLARFVMRSAVQIETIGGWSLHRLDDTDGLAPMSDRMVHPHGGGFAFAQPDAATPRLAWLAPAGDPAFDLAALARWRRADVACRLPLLPPALVGEYVPQALDLERLGAIRFDKGCYPGQEIAARLHFRGGNKRRLRHLQIAGGGITPGTAVLRSDGSEAGRILYAAPDDEVISSEAIAVLVDSDDAHWITSSGQPVRAGN